MQRSLMRKAQLGTGVAQQSRTAVSDSTTLTPTSWKTDLPVLAGRLVTLREPAANDTAALFDLLSSGDATRFGLEDPITELGVQQLIDRAPGERAAGKGFTYVIVDNASPSL